MEGVPGSDRQSFPGRISPGLIEGMSKAAIARHLRQQEAVYNWRGVRYRRPPLPSKLDPFKEIIRTRLAASAVRLFDEVTPGGTGSNFPGESARASLKRGPRWISPRGAGVLAADVAQVLRASDMMVVIRGCRSPTSAGFRWSCCSTR